MMRLLFLSLLLLLPAATAVSYEDEGSGIGEIDDEDYIPNETSRNVHLIPDKTTGVDESPDKMTVIVIVVVAIVLLVSAVVAIIMLVKRHMRLRQQAIYSVPTEQNQKEAI